MTTRDNHFDKLITTYFDRLWANETYLGGMGQLLKQSFAVRQQWNKNLEQFWSLWQLPNQEMQQRTLHGINTLLSEWRFEQEESNERLTQMESDLAEMKQMIAQLAAAQQPKADAAKSANPKAPKAEGKKGEQD